MYLFDTNAVIALLRQTSPALTYRVKTSSKSDIMLSAIVLHELFYGAYRSREFDRNIKTFRLLRREFPVIDFDMEDVRMAAELRAYLARAGTPIGSYDALIAGQAKARDLCVVTNNTREFGRVAGLRVEDWTKEAN